MTEEQKILRNRIIKEIDAEFPQDGLLYRNAVVAKIVAMNEKEKLTKDWLKQALLRDVADTFLTNDEAKVLLEPYWLMIEDIKKKY